MPRRDRPYSTVRNAPVDVNFDGMHVASGMPLSNMAPFYHTNGDRRYDLTDPPPEIVNIFPDPHVHPCLSLQAFTLRIELLRVRM